MTPAAHARLTELFGEAVELAAAERAALLARVRADDPAMADELAALLVIDGGGGLATGAFEPTAMERPAAPAALADTAVEPAAAAAAARAVGAPGPKTPAAGSVDRTANLAPGVAAGAAALMRARRTRPSIAGFRVLDVLGEGGMGTVYAGEQEAPRRPVAIKVLHSTSTAALTRFLAEAEIMARLDHPGIAKVLEAGDADGHPYFVMERVEGVTLDAHVRGEQVPLPRRLMLFAQLCDAIHHAHVKGVIHRDLKPSNVMVRADGRIAVLDFGIARVAAGGGSSGGETQAGELIGTPLYMSPEQARLRPDEVDARSDVYTLGVILYELASDELPYDVRGQPLPELARAIVDAPPRPLGRWSPALKGDLEAIADKALAKEPERRYQSAAALADDVRRHLEGATVSARVPGTLEQVRRFARRRPGVAAAAAGAVLGGAVFAAVVTMLWLDARAARRAAETERARVAATRDELEARNNQLVLEQARAALARDPTQALEWLASLTARGVDPADAWAIADEARGRGVARAVLRGHRDEVRGVAAVPNSRAVVSAGYDGRALWWDDGAVAPRELWKAGGRIHAARPSPDGALIAMGGDGGACRVVESATGALVADVPGLAGDVEKLSWSADGRWLAASDDRGGLWLWPRGGGQRPRRRLDGPTAEIESLAFAADTQVLVAGDDDGGVWRWDVAAGTGGLVDDVDAEVVAIWADATRVGALDDRGRVFRWDLSDGPSTDIAPLATGVAAKTGSFSRDGATVLLAGDDGQVVRITDERVELLGRHAVQVRSVAVTADGRRIATGGDDGTIQVWDQQGPRHAVLLGHTQRVRELDFTADGGELVSGDSAGVVRRWDLAAQPPSVLAGHRDVVEQLAVSPDGARLASADAAGELWVWSVNDGGGRHLGTSTGRVHGLAFARGGWVISAGGDGTLAWWAATAGPHHALGSAVKNVAATRDGVLVAAATAAGGIALFTGDGEAGAVLAGHAGGTDALAFSPDGTLLVSGGQDRAIRVWALATPAAAPLELGPVTDDIRFLRITADGGRLLSGGDDGRVLAWELSGGTVAPASQRELLPAGPAIAALDLGADGQTVIALGRDHVRRIITIDGAVTETPAEPGPAVVLAGEQPRVATGHPDGTIAVRSLLPRTLAALQASLSARR